MRFLDLIVPRSVIAGRSGRYARIAGHIENITRVESLAKPASTLTRLAGMGTVLSQSTKRSTEKSLGLTSSETRMLKNSLGYSGRSASEVIEDETEAFRLNRPALLGVLGSSGEGELKTEELGGCDWPVGVGYPSARGRLVAELV